MRRLLLALPILLAGCAQNMVDQGNEFAQQLKAIAIPDIDMAYQLAVLNDDKAAMQCYPALRYVVSTLQLPAGAVTLFQAGMDITNPAGYLNTACAAERAAIKARVQLFIGKTATIAAAFGL